MINPKIDFFRFSLNNKNNEHATFRNFMLDRGKADNKDSDKTIFIKLYQLFMDEMNKDFAKNEKQKKVLTVVNNKGNEIVNKYFDQRPQPNANDYIISGVINGGRYGKERISSKLGYKDDAAHILNKDQPVLLYYYIFLYLPLDHNEGLFMVHSDSRDESVATTVRDYIIKFFTSTNFKKPAIHSFVPQTFQKDFKKNAVVSSFIYKTTEIGEFLEDNNPFKTTFLNYDISVNITPKGEPTPLNKINQIKKIFDRIKYVFNKKERTLDKFDRIRVSAKDNTTDTKKVFEWQAIEDDFVPIVTLKNRVEFLDDGTPDFSSLDKYCKKLFEQEILPDLRPDKPYDKRMV